MCTGLICAVFRVTAPSGSAAIVVTLNGVFALVLF